MILVSHELHHKELALMAGWEALRERSPNIHGERFDGYRIRAFCNKQFVIGMLLTKGPEIHVAVLPNYRGRWLSSRLIKSVLGLIFSEYGFAVTSVMANNVKGLDFVERIGFKRQSSHNGVIHYRITP